MQIQSLQESISQLRSELSVDVNGTISTRLDIIFITSAAKDFAGLDPTNLPETPTSLDIWILRDQSIILTKKMLNLQFTSFIARIKSTFGQSITVTSQPYNQALVLMNKQFSFVRMDSSMRYVAKRTRKLTQIMTLFQQIIIQEQSFLSQLQAFTGMLHNAEIFTTSMSTQTDPTSEPQLNKQKRSISEFDLFVTNSSNYVGLEMSNGFNLSLSKQISNRT